MTKFVAYVMFAAMAATCISLGILTIIMVRLNWFDWKYTAISIALWTCIIPMLFLMKIEIFDKIINKKD